MKSQTATFYQSSDLNQLVLQPFALHQIPQLMSWFQSEQEVIFWSGYKFVFPYTIGSFTEQLKLDAISAYALVSKSEGRLLGFGQIMSSGRRCHLVRIAINPQCREQGLGKILMGSLCVKGQQQFNAIEATLFVNKSNTSALSLYKRTGFKIANYAGDLPNEQSVFMLKSLATG